MTFSFARDDFAAAPFLLCHRMGRSLANLHKRALFKTCLKRWHVECTRFMDSKATNNKRNSLDNSISVPKSLCF